MLVAESKVLQQHLRLGGMRLSDGPNALRAPRDLDPNRRLSINQRTLKTTLFQFIDELMLTGEVRGSAFEAN